MDYLPKGVDRVKIGDGLTLVQEKILSPLGDARRNVPKVVLVVTHSKAKSDDDFDGAAKNLRKHQNTVVVAVGYDSAGIQVGHANHRI